MNQSLSFWLLCSSMLFVPSAYAAGEALVANTTNIYTAAPAEASQAPLSMPPKDTAPAASAAMPSPVDAPAPVELTAASEDAPAPVPAEPQAPAAELKPLGTISEATAAPATVHSHSAPPGTAIPGALTLEAAIQKAVNASPRLRSADAAMRASQGERRQAGLWTNPSLDVSTENVGGTSEYSGFKSAQTNIAASQLIEIGGKRAARKDAAEAGVQLSQFNYTAERLNLIRDVTLAYIDAAAAQERLKIAGEQKELADDVLGEVGKRVAAARDPLIQRQKAQVTRSTAVIAYSTAERELVQAKRKLAALWGGKELPVLSAEALFGISEPEAQAEMVQTNNPDVNRWTVERERAKALLELERARAVPDPTVTAGWRDIRGASGLGPGTNDQAFLVGLSIPLPITNRNQGSIEQARFNALKADSDAEIARLQFDTDSTQRYQEMRIAYEQAESLEHEIIPAAQKSFSLSRQGYSAGKFAFLEVLDAQRTLFEAKLQRIAALRSYHTARAEVERLNPKTLPNTPMKEDDHAE